MFDLPPLEPAFHRYMATVDVPKPIAFRSGDFFTDPLPEADALVLGHVLHNWGEQDRIRLLRNAYAAVHPGGAVLIYDPMISDDMPPMTAVLNSLAMLVWSAGGSEYSLRDCHRWLTEVGFRPETVALADAQDDVLVIGHKDR